MGIRARNASCKLWSSWTILDDLNLLFKARDALRSILRRMYTNYAQQKGWSAKRSSFTEGLPACDAFETFSHAVQARWKMFPAPKISGTCAWRFMVNLSYSHTRLIYTIYTIIHSVWYLLISWLFVLFCLYGGDTIGLKSQDLGISWNLKVSEVIPISKHFMPFPRCGVWDCRLERMKCQTNVVWWCLVISEQVIMPLAWCNARQAHTGCTERWELCDLRGLLWK